MDTSEEVLILGRHILHAYIEDMDIEPLIDHLAPDVVWLGAGREMNAVGRDTVARIFRQGKDQLIPCHMSEERELMKNSGLSRFLLLRKQAHPIKCTCRLTSAALLSSAKILKENGKSLI